MADEDEILDALRDVYDPEIRVNIVELGLIYKIIIGEDGHVTVRMTLTSPNCPAVDELKREILHTVKAQDGVTGAELDLVWEPEWTPAMMSEEARLELGYDI
ncbi:MAG TPA: DUF59 domain-containing protein [Caldithrix abyssi]|uniref:DUF59 domain-containing protein n=1 Tax=Caldithrix abyssi TaxID=187145 RepID=A0A7V1LNP4_CALAY|nr:DUF59 domain-containing protein [Caldithrix abyssi]